MPVVRSKTPIKAKIEYKRPEQIKRTLGLSSFYEKRKKVLVQRSCGGLGDILMHRMLFEDFKLLMPNAEIHFACPKQYHEAVVDHPFVDKILDSSESNYHDYIVHYNTTTACGRWEIAMSPMSTKNRSDIWADHCGIKLTKHEMHISLSDEEKSKGRQIIEKHRNCDGKTVIICPISAMHNKNMSDETMFYVASELRKRGFFPVGLHSQPVYGFIKNDIPSISGVKIRESLSVINQADYIISVDTSHFHAAGGMKKPVVGVFTFVNGPTYSMYYPEVELVQGPCPLKYSGCYDWSRCPQREPKVPCCTGITSHSILSAFDRLTSKYETPQRSKDDIF